jgi:hypothetical protein
VAGLRRRARVIFDQAAKILVAKPVNYPIRDGRIFRSGTSTGQDYWTLSGAVDLNVKATGGGERKSVADLRNIGTSTARVDLPGKIFGESAFIHDLHLDGMVHARVVRQPNRGAAIVQSMRAPFAVPPGAGRIRAEWQFAAIIKPAGQAGAAAAPSIM